MQRRPPTITEVDTVLRARLREISAKHPRWGWRKALALCRGEGLVANHKHTQRLWREERIETTSSRSEEAADRAGPQPAIAGNDA